MNNDQEQAWPTTEELEKDQAEQNQFKKPISKGTSEYQAAWILSDEAEGEEEEIMKTIYFNFDNYIQFYYLFI